MIKKNWKEPWIETYVNLEPTEHTPDAGNQESSDTGDWNQSTEHNSAYSSGWTQTAGDISSNAWVPDI